MSTNDRRARFRLQYLSLGVMCAVLTVAVCYILRPELLGIRKAFSILGAFPPTNYIFNSGFVLAGLLVIADGLHTSVKLQKLCRYVAGIGFIMLGIFPIEHGKLLGDLHSVGGLIMLLASIISMTAHVVAGWGNSHRVRRAGYVGMLLLAAISATLLVLSNSRVHVLAVLGLAQYIGFASLVGWAFLDAQAD